MIRACQPSDASQICEIYDDYVRETVISFEEVPGRGRDVHCVVAGVALPNPASIALHEKLGFAKIGQFREIGWKFGQWVDVGYWELVL